MKVQCTKKLLDQLRVKPAAEPEEEEPVFSWHANLITLNRRKAVVLVNDSNRYTIVLYGLKAKDFQNLDKLIVDAIRTTFIEENIDPTIIESFLDASPTITYTKTNGRSHVAKMNQRCEEIYFYGELLDQKELLQPTISRSVSRSLVGDGKSYINPNEELYKDLEAFSGKVIFYSQAVQIKVTLRLENKKVWRRLIVPLNVSFSTLHEVLQIAFGWQDYHLHEFYILNAEPDQRNPYAYYRNAVVNLVCNDEALDYMNEVPMVSETGIKLSEYIPAYKNIQYNYDFGDDWNHVIKVEKIIEDYDKNYPVCVEGEGNAPPEDVGGEPGYEHFLRVIADQDHPDHQHLLEWGTSQGYQDFTIQKVNWRLGNL